MKQLIVTLILLTLTALPALAAPTTNISGPWEVDAAGFSNLSTALSSPTTAGKTVVITKPMVVNNKTLPADRQIKIIRGGRIDPAASKIFNFNGQDPDAGDYQIIGGAGTVVGLKHVNAAWLGDPTSQAALNKAVATGGIGKTISASGSVKNVHHTGDSAVIPGRQSYQENLYDQAILTYNMTDKYGNLSKRNYGLVVNMISGGELSPANDEGWIVPNSNMVPGSFVATRRGNSGVFLTALNPMITWTARPSSVVNVSGTTVTWVSGDKFKLIGWEHTVSELNTTTAVEIASVESDTSLTLTSSPGVLTGATFKVGSGIAVEIDVNANEDEAVNSATASRGLVIASGSPGKPGIGASIQATMPGTNDWAYGLLVAGYRGAGVKILEPNAAYPNAAALDVDGKTTLSGATTIKNTLKLDNRADNMLVFTPLTDAGDNPIIYATNAAGSAINWVINQDGTSTLFSPYTPLTYSASISINRALGESFGIPVTNGSAFKINDPANGKTGQLLRLIIYNNTAGELGGLTWGRSYRLAAWTQPAAGYYKSITFENIGGVWREVTRTPSDIPN